MPTGDNPNSKKNLKRTAGPGRPKMTAQQKIEKKAERAYYNEYLEKLRKLENRAIKVYDSALAIATNKRKVLTKAGEIAEVDPGAGEIFAGLKAADSITGQLYGQSEADGPPPPGLTVNFNIVAGKKKEKEVQGEEIKTPPPMRVTFNVEGKK